MSVAPIRRMFMTTQDRGASAVEYGLLVAAIAAVIVGVVFALGGLVSATFEQTCSSIANGAKLSAEPDCPGEGATNDTGGGPGGGLAN